MRFLLLSLAFLALKGPLAAQDSQQTDREKTDVVGAKGEHLGQQLRSARKPMDYRPIGWWER